MIIKLSDAPEFENLILAILIVNIAGIMTAKYPKCCLRRIRRWRREIDNIFSSSFFAFTVV
jgi:hypothetical protein